MYNVKENDGPAQPAIVLSNPSSTDITIEVTDSSNTAIGKVVINFSVRLMNVIL